ncbi:hypothetical protein GALL_502570 [mine drainage metagenome]|uniref:Surface lipoprotein assembly modifier C-terminal domain-containing protein n=1 Tax=mine drainage metagenome TaxID=410659 RepID=A0A1J5P967_9ZZZZ
MSDYLGYNGISAFVGPSKTWAGGLQTGLNLQVGARDFDANFPLMTAPRADQFDAVGFTLSHTGLSFRGFSPSLSCTVTYNGSNVALYLFRTLACQIAFNRTF